MSNPFTYTTTPATRKEAQANINYWTFEGMLSTDEIEEIGHIPATYRSFIKEMIRAERRALEALAESKGNAA